MPFLAIDGKYIPVFGDSVSMELIDIGDSGRRGLNGAPLRTRTRQLRRWTFVTSVMTYSDAQKYTAWIEGYGLRVPVTRGGIISEYASTGISSDAGTQTFAATGGAHSTKSALMTIASGSQWRFNPTFRMGNNTMKSTARGYSPGRDGCSIIGWREWSSSAPNEGVGATGFKHTIASLAAGSSGFSRSDASDPAGLSQFIDGASSAPANMGGILEMTYGSIALFGKRNDSPSTNAAVKWSDTIIVPFAIDDTKETFAPAAWTTGWVSQLYAYAQTYEMGDLPFRWLTGDVVGGDRVGILGRVMRSVQSIGRAPDGTLHSNLQSLEVELLEAPRQTATA